VNNCGGVCLQAIRIEPYITTDFEGTAAYKTYITTLATEAAAWLSTTLKVKTSLLPNV